MSRDHGPDAFERRLRFGCLFLALRALEAFTGTFWAVVIGLALLFSLGAMRDGDDFWHAVTKRFCW